MVRLLFAMLLYVTKYMPEMSDALVANAVWSTEFVWSTVVTTAGGIWRKFRDAHRPISSGQRTPRWASQEIVDIKPWITRLWIPEPASI
ncbi:hypothetical protein CAY35_03395 [Pseudoglutamicibacter cumminsii]|uniref:Uncharacterized protein n=1 Tax=Pseudoglutamicibacter cumminsii TaxID=156979 RepID=A0ABX5LB28_9MICC|nr:hypothetical protein CAY35_03395 [Pseudoglutamicibacter cumminsii]